MLQCVWETLCGLESGGNAADLAATGSNRGMLHSSAHRCRQGPETISISIKMGKGSWDCSNGHSSGAGNRNQALHIPHRTDSSRLEFLLMAIFNLGPSPRSP